MPGSVKKEVRYQPPKDVIGAMSARGRHGYTRIKGLTFTLEMPLREDIPPRIGIRVINKGGESSACLIDVPIDSVHEVVRILKELHAAATKPAAEEVK